ncbi:MAG: helix-turn-helix transcriptional regulator [Rhizobiaceae bacterium]|nr:helix-turn-helix transcriptional regulator [Rhizobiaceae bacterium]
MADRANADAFISRVYEASVIPELWREALKEFASAAEAKDALLVVSNDQRRKWVGSSAFFENICLEHYSFESGHERTNRLFAVRKPGFVTDFDVFTEAAIRSRAVFTDLLIPNGYGCGIATTVRLPSGDIIMFHTERALALGPFSHAIVERLDRLRPHLARASILASRLSMERAQSAAATLAALGLPAAVLDLNGRVLAANALLDAMIPAMFQDRSARLMLTNSAADALLGTALAGIAANVHDAIVCSIPIPATSDAPPSIVHLLPVKGAAHDIFARSGAIMVVTPIVARAVPGAGVLQVLFDLSPAEARVAEKIGDGATVADVAAELGVSNETVRSHLKGVLAKSGLHRQVDLVGLLRGIAVPPAKTPGQ